MTEFEREWTHTEREQHARLLFQLKRELFAKRQAEQAQTSMQRPVQTPHRELSQPSRSAPPVEGIPLPKRTRPQPSA